MRTHQTKPYRIKSRQPRPATKAQTTLRLPRKLYEKTKILASRYGADSANDFIVAALSAYVRALERKAIDESFEGMANDKHYQRETLRIMREFAPSDAETIALSERDLLGA
jgi:predicted DNA-binding protein